MKAIILGSGQMAKVHASSLQKHRDIKSFACWGRSAQDLAKLKRSFSKCNEISLELSKLLEKEQFDIAIVCLPHNMRFTLIQKVIQHGCHVLCEKPSAMTYEEAMNLEQLCLKTNKCLMIAYTLRYLDEVKELKTLIEQNKFGQISRIYFRTGRNVPNDGWLNQSHASTGVVGELAVHGIDLVRYLIDDEIVQVDSSTQKCRAGRNVPDETSILLHFKKGALASVHCSMNYPFFENELAIIGTLGAARVYRGKVFYRDFKQASSRFALLFQFLISGFTFPFHYIFKNPYRIELAHFINYINLGVQPPSSISFDLETIRVCENVLNNPLVELT